MIRPLIGILGDGQLAKYLVNYSVNLPCKVIAMGMNPGECVEPAHHRVGNIYDQSDVENFARDVDFITLENEFVPLSILNSIKNKLCPSFVSYAHIENKKKEKSLAKTCLIPQVPYKILETKGLNFQGPKFYKLICGGYDGYGNFKVENEADFLKMYAFLHKNKITEIIQEDILDFDREVSITLVRDQRGNTTFYPLVDTIQKDSKCDMVLVPAISNDHVLSNIKRYSQKLVDTIDYHGVMSIEYFIKDDDIYYNECSPRPHNSAHYTMDATYTSQFENHLRVILDLEVGLCDLKFPCAVMTNLIGTQQRRADNTAPENIQNASFYLYGKKEEKKGRKMGHLNLYGDNKEDLLDLAYKYREQYQERNL
jgi:5-(carboxyamino)imidazole ribonucleotide synthase